MIDSMPATQVAKEWEHWCGVTPWSQAMREWAELGGRVIWWGGFPRSKSAIPLCFVLVSRVGKELPGSSRLKDIQAAVVAHKGE